MQPSKHEIIKYFLPKAVLVPLTEEAKKSILRLNNKINEVIPLTHFPFRIGRESRIAENNRGFFVKLRLTEPSEPNNDIYLADTSLHIEISKEHCQIEFKDHTFFIIDRESTLGTKLNDEEIGKDTTLVPHVLKDGDIIKLGSSKSKYQFQFIILNN